MRDSTPGRGRLVMAKSRTKPEQIVTLLRQIEVAIANGKSTAQACKEAAVTEQTYYRWRKEYGGLKLDQARRLKELEKENARRGRGPGPGEAGAAGRRPGKLLSLERRRSAVAYARGQYGLSERHACRLLGQWRGSQRYTPTQRGDEDVLTRAIVTLAGQYGRYGYAGWHVGKDRVQCIWRREGLKVPARQVPRGRLWLADGSCVRLRPERARHVW